jgi:hypothetical protein
MACAMGCSSDADPAIATADPGSATQSSQADSMGCSVVSAGGEFANQTFPDQTKRFHIEFDATPSTANLDAVVGLGNGGASGFTDLAAIVRFNASGLIDARNGSVYQAFSDLSYQAGATYHIRLDVDPRHQSYVVYVRTPGSSSYLGLTAEHAYRTEQAGLTHLNNLASEVDADAGTLTICNVTVVTDSTTPDGCLWVAAGDDPASLPLADATALDTVTFKALTKTTDIDAVIGLSAGVPRGFTDIAAALRLRPDGLLDARDGDSYRASESTGYDLETREFRIIADLPTHRYAVLTAKEDAGHEVARRFKFRTEQSAVTHLDHLAVIVDGTQGSVRVCPPTVSLSSGVAYSIEGIPASQVIPLDDDSALINGVRVGPDGAGANDAAQATGLEFQRVLGDSRGNLYALSIGFTAVTITKRAGDQLLWTRSVALEASDEHASEIQDALVTQDGGLAILASAEAYNEIRLDPAGTVTSHLTFNALVSRLVDDGLIQIDHRFSQPLHLLVTRTGLQGQVIWQRDFVTDASVDQLIVDPEHNVLFGGTAGGQPDFGGGPLAAPDDLTPVYMVKLSSTGEHVFSKRLALHDINGIASNGSRIVVSGTRHFDLHNAFLLSFDAQGGPGHDYGSPGWTLFDQEWGDGGSVVMGLTGRVWWTRTLGWPLEPLFGPFLVTLEE